MKKTRYMGLDFGSKTIGIAVSDPFNMFAQNVEVIRRKPEDGLKKSIARIRELVEYYSVDEFVLGVPYKMNEIVSGFGEEVLRFRNRLQKELSLPVNTVDERRSSAMAEDILLSADVSRAKRKQSIDKIAAGIILQRFLELRSCESIENRRKEDE